MTENFDAVGVLREASDDLAAHLNDEPLPAFSPSPRRSPALLVAVLVFAVGGGAFLANRDRSETVVTPVTTPALESTDTTGPAPALEQSGPEEPAPASVVVGKEATPPAANSTKPTLLEWVVDPVYGTAKRRVTSADGTRFDRVSASFRQAQNADGSLLLTYHGDTRYRVYDLETGDEVAALSLEPDAEPQWHPTNPDLIRHLVLEGPANVALRLYETNVVTGARTILADIAGRSRLSWDSAAALTDGEEGAPSADGSRYAWIVEDDAGVPLGVVSYDLEDDELVGRLELRTDSGAIDFVSMAPSGDHVVVGYANAVFVYDFELATERLLIGGNHPSDLALNAAGDDVFVVLDFSPGADDGWLVSIDLATLERTRIFSLYEGGNTSVTISGRGFDKPGWVVMSTYDCKVDEAWTCDKVIAVELVAGGKIVNLAHTYNCAASLWTTPNAVVSRDFSRVYFNSDAGSCGDDAEVYELVVPEFE